MGDEDNSPHWYWLNACFYMGQSAQEKYANDPRSLRNQREIVRVHVMKIIVKLFNNILNWENASTLDCCCVGASWCLYGVFVAFLTVYCIAHPQWDDSVDLVGFKHHSLFLLMNTERRGWFKIIFLASSRTQFLLTWEQLWAFSKFKCCPSLMKWELTEI